MSVIEKAGRHGTLKGADFPDPAPFPDEDVNDLIDRYHAADTVGKARLSENLGEHAGLWFLRTISGEHDLEIQKAAEEPIEDNRTCVPGEPWERPITFAGSGVANMVRWDGETFWIVECKGGGSALGERKILYNASERKRLGRYCDQGTEDYIRELPGAAGENGKSRDGRITIGPLIQEAYEDGNIRYVKANCGGYQKLKNAEGANVARDLGLLHFEDFHVSGQWDEKPHEQPRRRQQKKVPS